ncbi:MAG: RDD family protein [Pseudomonadota bacterium]|nr:RDD family protein [Pseudomonadota bacterium]
MTTPSLPRRFACLVYEAMLLAAVLFVAGIPVVALTLTLPPALSRLLVWAYWLLIAGGYFTLFWRRGQTLAMKTWHIRLESADAARPSTRQAVKRYLLACLLFPVAWFWVFFDKDRQFLHDRLAGTRLVSTAPVVPRRKLRLLGSFWPRN